MQPTSSGPPAQGLDKEVTTPHFKKPLIMK